MLTIDNKFDFGDIVYLKTDREQLPHIVTALYIDKGTTLYEVITGKTTSKHYDFELSTEVNVLMQVT